MARSTPTGRLLAEYQMTKASEFVRELKVTAARHREAAISIAARAGDFMKWPMLDVAIGHASSAASIRVASDYFAIGEPGDLLRMPLSPVTAQAIADHFGWMLPTRRIVDTIWRKAAIRLEPHPIAADDAMTTLPRFVEHDRIVCDALDTRFPGWSGRLIAGHKKDVVLSNRLDAEHVAIYGWHRVDGRPIQNLNVTSHDASYCDYSHGIRFIDRRMTLGGETKELARVAADEELCDLLSDEGPLKVLRQPAS